MRFILLIIAWLLFMTGYNLTDPDKYSFLSRLSKIIIQRITTTSQSYDELRKKQELIGDTLFVSGIILGLLALAI